VLYASSEVEAKVGDGTTVRIVEETDYPFDENIEFTLFTPKPVRFPLLLRIPHWCEDAKVYVNEQVGDVQPKPLSYVAMHRTWQDGDKVRLELPMQIRLTVWAKNRNSVSVHRGPLTYSLKIGEKWIRYGGTEKWPAYEVYPTAPWNYGLIVDMENPARIFEVAKGIGRLPDQPFTVDGAPIQLIAKAKRIPQWKQEENGLVGALQDSPVRSDEPVEKITLIPMGCARLRISAFPTIGEGPDTHIWKESP